MLYLTRFGFQNPVGQAKRELQTLAKLSQFGFSFSAGQSISENHNFNQAGQNKKHQFALMSFVGRPVRDRMKTYLAMVREIYSSLIPVVI